MLDSIMIVCWVFVENSQNRDFKEILHIIVLDSLMIVCWVFFEKSHNRDFNCRTSPYRMGMGKEGEEEGEETEYRRATTVMVMPFILRSAAGSATKITMSIYTERMRVQGNRE